jgi:hypothetical protein
MNGTVPFLWNGLSMKVDQEIIASKQQKDNERAQCQGKTFPPMLQFTTYGHLANTIRWGDRSTA